MAVQNPVFALLFVVCTVAVIAYHCPKHAATPDERKVIDEIENRKEEIKKHQEKVKALIDTIAVEIEREKQKGCPDKITRLESCSDLKKDVPGAKDGNYIIDPDGEGGLEPFIVYCDMTDKNGVGVTVITHDSERRTLVNGYEDPGSYSRDIHYTGASLSQLVGLTRVSTRCEQFIKYECFGSVLSFKKNIYGWWVSRDSTKMTCWAGACVRLGECACGLTNSCADPRYGCNCDSNDHVWREDSGLLTDKTHLPVKQLRFGDTGDSGEQGYHTLGKLKCFGIA